MNWSDYSAEQVRTSYNSEGVRLALLFNQDYFKKFGKEITCLTCIGGFKKKFNEYINSEMKAEDLKYKLKAKYNGIPLGFGKSGRAVNGKITKQQAEYLAKNHPKGKDLFEIFTEAEKKEKKTSKKEAEKKPKAKKED